MRSGMKMKRKAHEKLFRHGVCSNWSRSPYRWYYMLIIPQYGDTRRNGEGRAQCTGNLCRRIKDSRRYASIRKIEQWMKIVGLDDMDSTGIKYTTRSTESMYIELNCIVKEHVEFAQIISRDGREEKPVFNWLILFSNLESCLSSNCNLKTESIPIRITLYRHQHHHRPDKAFHVHVATILSMCAHTIH